MGDFAPIYMECKDQFSVLAFEMFAFLGWVHPPLLLPAGGRPCLPAFCRGGHWSVMPANEGKQETQWSPPSHICRSHIVAHWYCLVNIVRALLSHSSMNANSPDSCIARLVSNVLPLFYHHNHTCICVYNVSLLICNTWTEMDKCRNVSLIRKGVLRSVFGHQESHHIHSLQYAGCSLTVISNINNIEKYFSARYIYDIMCTLHMCPSTQHPSELRWICEVQ